jgi:excisionase family DNA binding protein
MDAPNHQAVYSPAQAAKYLSISRSKLYVLVALGELPARKIGRRTIFMRADLDAFLASLPQIVIRAGA